MANFTRRHFAQVGIAMLASLALSGAALEDNDPKDIGPPVAGFQDPPHHADQHSNLVGIRSSSGSVVKIGEPIDFELTSKRDGFAHIYVFSASGRAQVWLENYPIRAGETLRYPFVIRTKNGWSLLAKDGKQIGYVEERKVQRLQ